MTSSRVFSALASLLFLAVCAYAGAALRGSADGVELMTVSAVTVTDSAELDGIVLRRERVLPRGAELVPAAGDGMRLPAGTAIEFADGTREHTGQSCVFFSLTDGFEALTPEAPEETDAEALDMLLAESPAESGRCGGRLVSGFDWYYAAYADAAGKSILPGVSGLQTIRHNHAYSLDPKALRSNPKIGNGVLTGNPLHEDMCEAAAMLPHLFMVNLVMNAQMQLHASFSGHYLKSWEAGCALVNKIYQVDVPEQADVIVASCGGFPKDISLYQGTKTVDNVEPGLKPGGTLILMLEAPEGGGPEEYFGWCKNLLDGTIEKRLREAFTVAGYIFFQNCEQAQRQKILLYSSIPDELVRPMGMRSFSDMGALLKEADLAGKSIYVIPNGATVVPHVCKEAVL